MTILRRSWIILLSILLFLSACGPITPANDSITVTPSPRLTEAAKATVTPFIAGSSLNVQREALKGVRVKVWHPYFGAEASLFESQVGQFNRVNEWGIIVSAESKGNFSELFLQTDAALNGSGGPQVVIAFPEHALGWRESVVDLNPYLDDPVYGMNVLERSDFANAVWMQDELDGVRYGVPAQRTGRFLLYNRTWARELGFDSPPATPSELEGQACAANQALRKDADPKNDSFGGWLIDADAMTALSWLTAFDGGVQDEQGYRFLMPDNITAFQYLKVLQQKNCAWAASSDISAYDRFASRQALFATAGLEGLADQSRAFFVKGSRDEWIVLAFPGNEKDALVVYGSSFVMFKSDDTTQLASWLFMRWMLSPDNQARWVRSTGLFPLRSATMDLLADYSKDHPQWADAVKLLSRGTTTPKLASWRLVRVMLGDGFRDMFDVIRHPDLTDGQVPLILRQMDVIAEELNK
jgi:ABC-type glycerol-3-phosphate transport system substrate-binding protein